MSSPERVLYFLSGISFSFDGAILGVTLAISAFRSFIKSTSTSAALKKIKEAPEVSVPDLRSLISEPNSSQRIVVVRGIVKPKYSSDVNQNNDNVLVSPEIGDNALIVLTSQTYVYSGWKTLFHWTNRRRFLLETAMPKQEPDILRMVPFVIVDTNQQSKFVVVNMDGSRQPLPLTTVYHHLEHTNSSPVAFLQTLFLPEYPVGMLDVEKILPPGRDITAVGICSFRNGVPEIKSCHDLPYFLSEMSKEKMILDLMSRSRVLFWSGVIMGCMSIGVLSIAAIRTWNRWKRGRQEGESPQTLDELEVVDEETEDAEEIPEGELCVICVTRKRIPAFVPCGHIVCCRRCALAVERQRNPKCPVCLQSITGSMRVYYS